MNPALRTRTDYHTFYSSYYSPMYTMRMQSWLKPALWLGIGIMIGMICAKMFTPNTQTLAFSSVAKSTLATPKASEKIKA